MTIVELHVRPANQSPVRSAVTVTESFRTLFMYKVAFHPSFNDSCQRNNHGDSNNIMKDAILHT
ncbi:hypothetical protein B0H34DRAFT_200931 [Crassisporium funariophilum]|nr:hypothetical protein B0H34DRAFT_200931 [Crassisporium funariophilum]